MTTATVDLSKIEAETKTEAEAEGKGAQAPHAAGPTHPRFKSIPIMDTWASILEEEAAKPLVLDGSFKDIVEVFTARGLPRRLVILGEPGSGKSMIAQWLTVQLLEASHAEQGASHTELKVVP